jgi:hypothetical protein
LKIEPGIGTELFFLNLLNGYAENWQALRKISLEPERMAGITKIQARMGHILSKQTACPLGLPP